MSIASLAIAQDKNDRSEQLEARKVAFISTELALSPIEAQSFWPLYNEYQQRNKENKKKLRAVTRDKKANSITEVEADELITVVLEVEEEELLLKKEYTQELRKVIPASKIAKLYLLENKFKEKVLNKIKRKMKDKRR
mgnify:CR=1 FL=1